MCLKLYKLTVISLQAYTFCEFKTPPPLSSGYLNWFKSSDTEEFMFLS
jgi:hypothetical protein